MRRWGRACVAIAASGVIVLASVSIPCPPKSGTGEFFLAKAYHQIGELEKARQMAEAGAAAYPRQARFQVLLGMVAASQDQPEKAIDHNLRALELEPGNTDAWHNMGLTYLLTGRSKDAIRCFEKAISFEDRDNTRYLMKQAYEQMRQLE